MIRVERSATLVRSVGSIPMSHVLLESKLNRQSIARKPSAATDLENLPIPFTVQTIESVKCARTTLIAFSSFRKLFASPPLSGCNFFAAVLYAVSGE